MTTDSPPLPPEALDALDLIRVALRERLQSKTLRLPVLPKVAGEVLALAQDADADMMDLSALIHRDQALASQVLRISNSAAYAGGGTIVSLQQAITRLGMKLLGDVAIAISVHGELFCVPGYQPDVKLLWRHALASGTYGKEIARLKRTNVESQFLCGLLHTVGKPIVLRVLVELLRERKVFLPRIAVFSLMEEFHCSIGRTVAAEWKLPQQVLYSAAYYLNRAETSAFQTETAITSLAHQLADWVLGADGTVTPPESGDPVILELNIYPDELNSLLERRESVLAMVTALDL